MSHHYDSGVNMGPARFFTGVGKFLGVARIFSSGCTFFSKKADDLF